MANLLTHTTELKKQTADNIITFYSPFTTHGLYINILILRKTLIAHLTAGMNSLKEILDIPLHIKISQTCQPIVKICKLDNIL